MKVIRAFLNGIRDALSQTRLSLYFWLAGLLPALGLLLPSFVFFKIKLGRLSDATFFKRHPDFLQLVFSGSNYILLLTFSIVLLFVGFIMLLTVEAGTVPVLTRKGSFSLWRRNFWKFLKIELLFLLELGIGLLISAGFLFLLSKIFPYYREKAFTHAMLLGTVPAGLFLLLVVLSADMAKIISVVEGRGAFKSLLRGNLFVFRHWLSFLLLYLLCSLLWLLLGLLLKRIAGALNFPLVSFLIMQIAFIIRGFARVALFSAENSLYTLRY